MFTPKLIEKENDLLCKSQHSQPIESVILDPFISNNQRLLCKACQKENQYHSRIVDYQQLKLCFEEQQKERIQRYQLIIEPHIQCVESMTKIIGSLKSRLFQQLDNLLWLSKDWITQLVDSVTSYSFFEELDILVSQQEPVLDLIKLIETVKQTNQNWNSKMIIKLDQFKFSPEFKSAQETFNYLDKLTDQQNDEVKAQPIIHTNYSFLSIFQELEGVNYSQESSQEYKSLIWDEQFEKFVQVTFSIRFTKDKKIQYTRDGYILRSEEIKDTSKQPDVITNLEQIIYLKWVGDYGKINKKIGRWTTKWIGQTLNEIGGQYRKNKFYCLNKLYSDDGTKFGQWHEIFQNFWTQAQVYEKGEYVNDLRQRQWKYIYQGKEIGGGEYNRQGEKNGRWVELSDRFWDKSQVIYTGEYKNGKKVGSWKIYYRKGQDKQFQKIGGGSYDKGDQNIKIGNWTELSDEFSDISQVLYDGEYKNSKKVGNWKIYYRRGYDKQFKKIGGGSYDKGDQNIKHGNWFELSDDFRDISQVLYNGEYNKGKKVGLWKTFYRGKQNNESNMIGGGSYDKGGQELKMGNWIELSQRFCYYSQVTYIGDYQGGKKVGIWESYFNFGGNQHLGGGSYDSGGIKIGMWIEQRDRFYSNSQVIQRGSYLDGKKTGNWDIYQREWNNKHFNLIGGGSYDAHGDGIKIGRWVELCDWYSSDSQVTQNGQYKNGKKVGNWVVQIGLKKYSEINYDQ